MDSLGKLYEAKADAESEAKEEADSQAQQTVAAAEMVAAGDKACLEKDYVGAKVYYTMAVTKYSEVSDTAGEEAVQKKLDAVEQVNVIYSNAAALVIPLVKALMGDAYVIYSCAFIIVQLVLLWTHASSLLQGSSALDWKKVLTNINMIAIAAGALLYWFRVVLPAPLQNTMSTVGNMMGPMGMLLAGMAIAEKPLREVFCTRRNYLPTVLRLVVCPLVVLVLLWVCHASSWVADGKNILMTVYLAAITPACATVTSMAQLYDRDAAHSSALYVLTTLLSIVSMPVMIGLFDLLL